MAEPVKGLQELLTSMDGLPLLLRKKLIAKALRQAAEPIKQRAADLAPDDPTTPGSRIRDSMMITVTEQTAERAVAKIGPSRKGFMGSFSERGTKHQRRRAWLEPAFEQTKDEAQKIMGQVLMEGIEDAFRKKG